MECQFVEDGNIRKEEKMSSENSSGYIVQLTMG